MKALNDWAILSYEKEKETTATSSGILIPSQRNQRIMMKGKSQVISSDPDAANLPDVIRVASVVSSKKFNAGARVMFNKHDGFGFLLGDEYLYVIPNDRIMAELDADEVGDNTKEK